MYHFVSEQTQELRLSDNVLISSQTTQYLKCFQLDAIQFLYDRLSKQEFVIYNDESGLGKCAAVVALLNALGAAKKTLIALQNDDHLLAGWQFHLGVLTDLPVCVIKDVNDSTESAHSVYLCKWSVLRSIGDLSKLKFDYVIVDHRGYTLNNNFCTSMLLKQYERKVNIVISSVDITSDIKLIFNVLRLGGCLEHQYRTFSSFERKFRLPDVKEVLSKRVDLEEYYKQRGVLGEYIKEFRLRRYRHQFDSYLPLVTPEQYKKNLSLWLADNNSNSTISQSTIASSTDVRSTYSTDEILQCLSNLKQEPEEPATVESDKMSVSDHSDDVIAMEPLIFDMSDSDDGDVAATDVVLLSSDDCEIVTPPITPPLQPIKASQSPGRKSKRRSLQKANNTEPVELSESETEQPTTSNRKLSDHLNRGLLPPQCPEDTRTTRSKQPLSRTATEKTTNAGKTSEKTPPNATQKKTNPANAAEKTSELPATSKSNQATKSEREDIKEQSAPSEGRSLRSKTKASPTLSKTNINTSPITPKTETRPKRGHLREINSLSNYDNPRQTRSMKRLTRSADSRMNSKYMSRPIQLDFEKKTLPREKRIPDVNQTPKTSKRGRAKVVKDVKEDDAKAMPTATVMPDVAETVRKRGRPRKMPKTNVETTSTTTTAVVTPTPELLSSSSITSDNSYLQCAQKPPDSFAELEMPEFRTPFAPQEPESLILPSTLSFFSESEVAFVPNSNQKSDIVVVNSSHDEGSQQSTQSRRTKALKRKRTSLPPDYTKPSTSNFGLLLAEQRAGANKSPDIFSNCSDISQIMLAQPVPPASPFEGFKIFGSEVKQKPKTQQMVGAKKKRERSCLELLEKMFEPNKTEANKSGMSLLPNLSPPKASTTRAFTLLDDDIFEITNNGEFGSRLRLDSTGNVSPVHPQQSQQLPAQRNKITKYLIGSGCTPEDSMQRMASSQVRKSPKTSKSTQATKLTRWFSTAAMTSGQSQSAPTTPVTATEKVAQAREERNGAVKKRKRLSPYK